MESDDDLHPLEFVLLFLLVVGCAVALVVACGILAGRLIGWVA